MNDPLGLTTQHEELSGYDRVLAEVYDILEIDGSHGFQGGLKARVGVLEAGFEIDLGSPHASFEHGVVSHFVSEGASVFGNFLVGVEESCSFCGAGFGLEVEKTAPGQASPGPYASIGAMLDSRSATTEFAASLKVGPFGSLENDGDFRIGAGYAIPILPSFDVAINISEIADAASQAYSCEFGSSAGGFVLYASKVNSNSIEPACAK